VFMEVLVGKWPRLETVCSFMVVCWNTIFIILGVWGPPKITLFILKPPELNSS
jgi:hypothetical protein